MIWYVECACGTKLAVVAKSAYEAGHTARAYGYRVNEATKLNNGHLSVAFSGIAELGRVK